MTRHELVDRFRLDHSGREMWTWLDSSPSAKIGSYLDRVLVRRADLYFVSYPKNGDLDDARQGVV